MEFITTMSLKQRTWYTLLSALVLVSYLFLGALLFIAIERPYQEQNPTLKITTLEDIIDNLRRLEYFLNNSAGSDIANVSSSEILGYTADLATKLLILEEGELVPWNLYTGIHFCMTAVTTIGYGYITPATQLGRVVCIPYILLGIPLNLFLSANLGYFIARLIVMLYTRIARCTQLMCFSWRLSQQKKSTEPNDQAVENRHDGVRPMTDYGELTVNIPKHSQRLPAHYTNSAYREDKRDQMPGTISRNEIGSRSFGSRANAAPHRSKAEHEAPTRPSMEGTNPGKKDDIEDLYTCPMWFIFSLLIAFCSVSALFVVEVEPGEWTFVDALYFVMVTFTTVGFGDMKSQVTEALSREIAWWVRIPPYMFMELGLIIMVATLTIWSENVKLTARRAKRAIKRNCRVPIK